MSQFDVVSDREGTWSIKWDYTQNWGGARDLIPLWVADMDFPAPPAVLTALRDRIDHGILGYTWTAEEVRQSIVSWIQRRHGWIVDPETLLFFPGVVPAIVSVLEALSAPGDGVIIQPPVYYPFREVIEAGGRQLVENPLLESPDGWRIDFDHLEKVAAEARVLLISSPHNPVGRVWSDDELAQLGQIARRHDLLVISDEIHWDLILPGFRHSPFAKLEPQVRTITLTSPSKTFNLAGLALAYGTCSHEDDKTALDRYIKARHGGLMNVMGLTAAKAAYDHGDTWVNELNSYVADNLSFLTERLQADVPGVSFSALEGTYLAWADVSGLERTGEEVEQKLKVDGGVWVHGGHRFGVGGEAYIRINLATPRTTLSVAADRMARLLKG